MVNYYNETQILWVFLPASVLVAVGFSVNIALLENKKWADYAEVIKLILMLLLGLGLINISLYKITGIVLASIAILMLIYTCFIARNYHRMHTTLKK